MGSDLYDSQSSQVSQDVLRIERGRKTKDHRKLEKDAPKNPNHRSGPIIKRRALYPIALHGRFHTKERALKSQFSDTLLGEPFAMYRMSVIKSTAAPSIPNPLK